MSIGRGRLLQIRTGPSVFVVSLQAAAWLTVKLGGILVPIHQEGPVVEAWLTTLLQPVQINLLLGQLLLRIQIWTRSIFGAKTTFEVVLDSSRCHRF